MEKDSKDLPHSSLQSLTVVMETVLQLQGTNVALDCFVQALIASHPQPDLLKRQFQAALSQRLLFLGDLGYRDQTPPEMTQGTIEALQQQADAWLRLFP
ncbi:hypothetical protein [Dyella sp.]|jgi:hypothetical protein|uniref:hypothetical protein n=1 Tax=Dyella sp. TaxID=1869338 RepID=UPI002FDB5466